jgi:metal-sulfur cluster biosynthetic enzyme
VKPPEAAAAHGAPPFPYAGPQDLRAPIVAALSRVIDPEVAMTIVDVGLVYGVEVRERDVRVRLTMTSAACPVADVIVDDVWHELSRVVPASFDIDVELVWEPAWTAERMTDRARRIMGW